MGQFLKPYLAALLLAWAVQPGSAQTVQTDGLPAVLYATQSGQPAFDDDPYGGNPFASALIAALDTEVSDAKGVLSYRTLINSEGQQKPDLAQYGDRSPLRPQAGENAVALVVVFSDYGDRQGLASLPGAAFDAFRVAGALEAAGYRTTRVVARNAEEYRNAVASFAEVARGADSSLLYSTGHGIETGGQVYLIPPEAEQADDILARTLPLEQIAAMLAGAPRAVLFYAGCRDNPLGL